MKNTARIAVAVIAFLFGSLSASVVARQQNATQNQPVAKYSDVYCTGFIADVAPRADLQVIGAEKENLKAIFAEGDVVFLNGGRRAGIQPGAVYSIIRPLGEMSHPFTKKRLGYYVREVGMLRVIEVEDKTSTAEITVSCDTVEFGDLLRPYEEIVGPNAGEVRPLPRFGEGSGGTTGQIVMSPGFHENLSANRVVFIDLGTRQDVHPGDLFTIYREIGRSEGLTKVPQDKINKDRSSGYESDRLRGGKGSIQSTRVSVEELMRNRPQLPRKVLGELVVIRTEMGTSVAMITRTNAEVQIGDMIERTMN